MNISILGLLNLALNDDYYGLHAYTPIYEIEIS
jgi:hypothetical protein